jgi:hypothetical protein
MTRAVELGIEGLKGFIGREVKLTYPATEFHKGFSERVVITDIYPHENDPIMMAVALFGEHGSTWIWKDTDVSEVKPSRLSRWIQRKRRK